MKLLSICVPTYKRSDTLRLCIDSVVEQILQYGLTEKVHIYVVNDASPDDTAVALTKYETLEFFSGVNRDKNLGMSANIKAMLKEASQISTYQLIITDDDRLQPDALKLIIKYLTEHIALHPDVSAIWTPRYSYTDDDQLHTVVCNEFKNDRLVKPSIYNVARYMKNGFILSGLIVRADSIDYEYWEDHIENAYFPVLFFGKLLLNNGACYWKKNIVHHTVLNDCNWERWGASDLAIDHRLFSDYLDTYSIMAEHISVDSKINLFYLYSFKSMHELLLVRLMSGTLNQNKESIYKVVDELKSNGFLNCKIQIKVLVSLALFKIMGVSTAKILITRLLLLVGINENIKNHYKKRINLNIDMLRAIPVLVKSVI